MQYFTLLYYINHIITFDEVSISALYFTLALLIGNTKGSILFIFSIRKMPVLTLMTVLLFFIPLSVDRNNLWFMTLPSSNL